MVDSPTIRSSFCARAVQASTKVPLLIAHPTCPVAVSHVRPAGQSKQASTVALLPRGPKAWQRKDLVIHLGKRSPSSKTRPSSWDSQPEKYWDRVNARHYKDMEEGTVKAKSNMWKKIKTTVSKYLGKNKPSASTSYVRGVKGR